MKLIEMEKVLSELCLSHKDIIYIDKNETAERIRKIPSIELEPKRGEWIKVDDVSISCRCSVCGWEAHLYEDDVYCMPYCPNCGADMREREGE